MVGGGALRVWSVVVRLGVWGTMFCMGCAAGVMAGWLGDVERCVIVDGVVCR
jgi:hypothetical protein